MQQCVVYYFGKRHVRICSASMRAVAQAQAPSSPCERAVQLRYKCGCWRYNCSTIAMARKWLSSEVPIASALYRHFFAPASIVNIHKHTCTRKSTREHAHSRWQAAAGCPTLWPACINKNTCCTQRRRLHPMVSLAGHFA